MKKGQKIYRKNVGTPVTNKEAFDYLNEKSEKALEFFTDIFDLDIDGN